MFAVLTFTSLLSMFPTSCRKMSHRIRSTWSRKAKPHFLGGA